MRHNRIQARVVRHAISFCLVLLAGCFRTENSQGPTTPIPPTSSGHWGRLFLPDGKPAANANVRLIPVSYSSASVEADSNGPFITQCDSDGVFRIPLRSDGPFNILGDLNGLVSFQGPVRLEGDTGMIAPDTLGKPAVATGVVSLEPGDILGLATVKIPGTFHRAETDSLGRFAIPGLAEGKYTIRIHSQTEAYATEEKSFEIIKGRETVSLDTIRLPFAGIPSPRGLRGFYDPQSGSVSITWDEVASPPRAAYYLYRWEDTATDRPSGPLAIVSDNGFVDNVFTDRRSARIKFDLQDPHDYDLVYTVRVRTQTDEIGPARGHIKVRAISPILGKPGIRMFAGFIDEVETLDSVTVRAIFESPTRSVDSAYWSVAGQVISARGGSATATMDSVVIRPPSAGNIRVAYRVKDRNGIYWADSLSIKVVARDSLRNTPLAEDIRISYDTLAGSSRISWRPIASATELTYLVYAADVSDLFPSTEPIAEVKDGFFVHRIFSNPVDTGKYGILDTNQYTFAYRIRVKVAQGEIGAFSPEAKVSAPSPSRVRTQVRFADGSDSIEFRSAKLIRIAYENASVDNDSIIWSVNGKVLRSVQVSGKSGVDSLTVLQEDMRNAAVEVRVRDSRDRSWSHSKTLIAFIRPPIAYAGPDTVVLGGDPLHLSDRSIPGTGKIVKWHWILPGDERFIEVSNGDTDWVVSRAQAKEKRIGLHLRVEDEFGNSATAARSIYVADPGEKWLPQSLDLPYIDGRDVKRSFVLLNGKCWLLLSSWDESGVKPVQIWNSTDMRSWNRVVDSAAFPARIIRSVVVYKGLIWIFGGEKSMAGKSGFNDVWSSSDGAFWRKVADSSPIDTGNNGDYAFVSVSTILVSTYNGVIWDTFDGIDWKRRGQGIFRGDEIGSVHEFATHMVMVGTKGVYETNDGMNGLRLDSPDTEGWRVGIPNTWLLVNDGYRTLRYDLGHGRVLRSIWDFPEQWTVENPGDYHHSLFKLGPYIWALQGSRFRGEERKTDAWITY
jgi:hypothetical protein